MLRFFIRKISRIHVPFSRKKLSEKQCREIISTLKDGDVLLTHVAGELTNLGLSHWSHAGIFFQGKIWESTTEGVHDSDPMFFLAKKDDVEVHRPVFNFTIGPMHTFFTTNLHKPYDFEFKDSTDEFYCFELAARLFMYASVSAITLAKTRTFLGKKYLASTFQNTNQFQKVK